MPDTPVPHRIQLRRTAGWRKPDGTVVVSRPSRWANPFVVRKVDDARGMWHVATLERTPGGDTWKVWTEPASKEHARVEAVELFALHIGPMGNYEYGTEDLERLDTELGGRNLACWCPTDGPCHADVLLELAAHRS